MGFLESEKRSLELARGILTGETVMLDGAAILEATLRETDYLYIHFPDGYKGYSADPAFLKRVRIELEYFLKTIKIALREIGS